MVLSVSMFDTPFELPNIAAPIIASVDSKPMTLSIIPLTTIHITTVEPIDPHSMPQTFPILPSIPAPPCPCLHTIPIILPINPIPLIPPTHVIVINPTSPTLPLLEFTLVHIPIAVNLHPTSPTRALHLLRVRPNGPHHRVGRRGGRRRRWWKFGGEQSSEEQQCQIEGNQQCCWASDDGEEIQRARVWQEKVEGRKGEEHEETEAREKLRSWKLCAKGCRKETAREGHDGYSLAGRNFRWVIGEAFMVTGSVWWVWWRWMGRGGWDLNWEMGLRLLLVLGKRNWSGILRREVGVLFSDVKVGLVVVMH